jgi:mannose-6-phosphate isomerase-like protein (cupin superfamily)
LHRINRYTQATYRQYNTTTGPNGRHQFHTPGNHIHSSAISVDPSHKGLQIRHDFSRNRSLVLLINFDEVLD